MKCRFGKSGLVVVLCVVAGCAPLPVELAIGGARRSADVSDLAAVLKAVRTGDGRFDPRELKRLAPRLDAQLARMAVSGPTITPNLYPTYGSRWAYWYNARAGWSLKLALLAGCPERVRPGPFRRRLFPLDGREMTLDDIDHMLLADARRTSDFRLAACVPGVTFAYAQLPERPMSADDFSRGLIQPFEQLLLDGRRVVLDVYHRRLLLPEMLWACRDLVLAGHRRRYGADDATVVTALRASAQADARRRLEDAIGYRVRPLRPDKLAIPGRTIYYPGKYGRVEP